MTAAALGNARQGKTRVLFVCTGNACRSQMAEALLRHLGGEKFEVLSAGTSPAGFIHPLAITAMERMGVSIADQHSKSWLDFAQMPLDIVITVCDAAAGQPCPRWAGDAIRAHWPLPDPSFHLGTQEEREEMALRVAERLRVKIEGLIALDLRDGREAIQERLNFLGDI